MASSTRPSARRRARGRSSPAPLRPQRGSRATRSVAPPTGSRTPCKASRPSSHLVNSRYRASTALTCSASTEAASAAWRAWSQSLTKRPTECSRASSSSGSSSKLVPVRLAARSKAASMERWANPIRPPSRASTLAGSAAAASPVATERAAAVLDIRHWWRTQSIGEFEPWTSYSSLAAKAAASQAKRSSRRSMPWRKRIRRSPRSNPVISPPGVATNASMTCRS